MSAEADLQRSLVAIAAALNEAGLDKFDTERVGAIVAGAVGSERRLTVDAGGGLHEPSGIRIAAIRRAPSGEWIIDGQNVDAPRADAPIPAARPAERD
jgi:hypothetical protein